MKVAAATELVGLASPTNSLKERRDPLGLKRDLAGETGPG
jgi:hypothetical protein